MPRPPGHRPETPPVACHPLVAWLLDRAGLKAERYRPEVLNRRLPACLRALKVTTPEAARERLEAAPELVGRAIDALLIGVTEFFRDAAVFGALEQRVIPDLASRRTVRVCSVGAAAGQELLSVGMLLAEAGLLGRSECVGFDCRTAAVHRATTGRFAADDVARLGEERRRRFFKLGVDGWTMQPWFQGHFRWRWADVTAQADFGSCDLLLFRNVAIYLAPATTAQMWRCIEASLAPGGYLVTGRAELPPAARRFSRVAPCIFRRGEGGR